MAGIFKAPDWDTDLPDTNFSFNKKMKKPPKLNDDRTQIKKKKKKLSPMAMAINSVAIKKVKEPVKATKIENNNDAAGKYVRINKKNSSCSTTSTLIDEQPLNGKKEKRKIKQRKKNSSTSLSTGTEIPLPKRMKMKNHDDNDTQKKNDNLLHDKGLKLKSVQVKSNNQTNGIKNEKSPPALSLTFREQLMANLKGSRFRYLNEMLYTTDGKNAANIFKDDPMAFKAYHDGYRQQVQHWPMNPLDRIIKAIRKMPKNLIVADFGCGEGRLAKSISQKTYSLDLISAHDGVIACDMANTPLQSDSINVAVYCLSLMGTNLQDFFLEANRVLKIGGIVKIAEVESRFDNVTKFIENVSNCGFTLMNKDLTKNLFYFLTMKKIKNVTKMDKCYSVFSLKPCLYKKR